MDEESLQPQISDLQTSISALETSLAPLLAGPLSTASSTLPLLEKAKLYVLATYALESILFSFIRLNGVDAKEHPVYLELSRVKEYFSKISVAEGRGKGAAQPRLDKGAAGRFVRAGLAGNADIRGMEGRGTHTRFEAAGKRLAENEEKVEVVRAADVDVDGGEEDEIEVKLAKGEEKAFKKGKRMRTEEEQLERKKARKEKKEKRGARTARFAHLHKEGGESG